MSIPTWQVKIYDTTDALTHTITTDLLSCSFTDECTTGVGSFSLALPAKKGFTNAYDDIGNHYKVEIYPGYGGVYTHLFTGRITDFTTQSSTDEIRIFEGKGLGEILERFLRKNQRWQEVDADDIVADLADDAVINLSTDIDADATHETITVASESYFDVLRKVSDYWYDAGTQVKRDFGVNKDNELFWKSRPMRTVGVETISEILSYNLKYSIISSKNDIQVLGAATAPLPVDMDEWTEDSTTGWTLTTGTTLESTAVYPLSGPKEGSKVIHVNAADAIAPYNQNIKFHYALPNLTTRTINKVRFWYYINCTGVLFGSLTMRLLAPDSSNYFQLHTQLTKTPVDAWYWRDYSLGEGTIYDADENPTGIWDKTGNANWWNLQGIEWEAASTNDVVGSLDLCIDKLSFYPERWRYTSDAEDAVNQASYGERQAEYTDETLTTIAECQKRQETLLYQQKDRIMRLDFTVPGNTNILMGDRLSITLPLDNLAATNFDVVGVTHIYAKEPKGYQTTAHCLSTASTRRLPPLTPLDSIQLNLKNTRDIVSNIYGKIVK